MRVRTFWTELRDQSLHAIYAVCLIFAFVYSVPAWLATVLVMAVALLRELEQHDWKILEVGRRDLAFFFLACLIFDIWYYFLR
jgi:hypothetical protein